MEASPGRAPKGAHHRDVDQLPYEGCRKSTATPRPAPLTGASPPRWRRLWWRLRGGLQRLAPALRRGPLRGLRVIAVTGSAGKTTTRRAIEAVLGLPPDPRNYNNAGFIANELWRTPPWRRHRVFEAGIERPGQMARIARLLRPDIAVVTNLASDHRAAFADLAEHRAEKALLVRALGEAGLAVLNGDDPEVRAMAGATRARTVLFGLSAHCAVRATDVRCRGLDGLRFALHLGGRRHPARTRLVGRVMLYPLLAAAAVAAAEGLPPARIVAALATLPPTPGRLEPLPLVRGAWALRDDYKASEEAIDAGFDVFATLPAARRFIVMADLRYVAPARQAAVAARFGRRMAALADTSYVLRGMAAAYRAGYPAGEAGRCVPCADLSEVAARLGPRLGPGDLVLVKARAFLKLERLTRALQGRPSPCRLDECRAVIECAACPFLSTPLAAVPAEALAPLYDFRIGPVLPALAGDAESPP